MTTQRTDSLYVQRLESRLRTDGVLRADAGETYFFARELEQILAEQFDIKKAQLKARQMLQSRPVDRGVMSLTYRQFESFGKAKAIADHSDDLPLVNAKGLEFTQRMQSFGAAFEFSVEEIEAAARAGRPLERDRSDAARKVLDQKLDLIASLGDSSYDLKGLLSLTTTLTETATTKAAGGTAWATATPDEILADLNAMVNKIVVSTLEVERPTRILLPTAQYQMVSQRARSAVSDTTILQFFKANNPGIEVMSWERLSLAGAGLTDTRAVAYDPAVMNVSLLMAIDFEMQAPQLKNYAYKVNCRMRTGGVIAPYPQSLCYMDSI